jgi:hypothetical protein
LGTLPRENQCYLHKNRLNEKQKDGRAAKKNIPTWGRFRPKL